MAGIRSYSKRLLRKLPITGPLLEKRRLEKRFQVELDLIHNRPHDVTPKPSILHFSLNKAATQYTSNILKRCGTAEGMLPVGLPGYAFHFDFPYLDHLSAEEMRQYQYVFRSEGYVYSVFGGMIEGIPDLDRYRVVLMVRDPRDVLVSNYYSVAHSHPEPGRDSGKHDEFMQLREAARSMSIDGFVLAECDGVRAVLERYKALLLDRHPGILLTRYEEMVADFEQWLDGLLQYCGFSINSALRQSLIEEHRRSRPAAEDVTRHIRRGVPGDYMAKLESSTIHELNTRLAPVLEAFGYGEPASLAPSS